MSIQVNNVSKFFKEKKVIENLSLNFSNGKISVILAPSGYGKSTLFNLISDLTPLDSGKVTISKGEEISYIFPEDRLFPYLTIFDNIALVLKDKEEKSDIEDKVINILDFVGLKEEAYKFPKSLSSGMKSRVNIARALVLDRDIILADEPFNALDISLRNYFIDTFKSLAKNKNKVIVVITHDLDTALSLADEIYLFKETPFREFILYDDLKDKDGIKSSIERNLKKEI